MQGFKFEISKLENVNFRGIVLLKGIRVPLLNLEGELEDDFRERQEGLRQEVARRGEANRGVPHKGAPPLFLVARVGFVGSQITRKITVGERRRNAYAVGAQSTR